MSATARTFLSVILSLVLFQAGTADDRWWVFFRDKQASMHSQDAHVLVSARSLARRAKVLTQDHLTDWRDLPVSEEYVRQVRGLGATVHASSKILNAVSVEADEAILRSLRALPFVKDVQPVRSGRRRPEPLVPASPSSLPKQASPTEIDYGLSLEHHLSLNSVPLHELGVIGHGVLVGMVDDGYNSYRTHEALRTIPVLAAYDFIQRDTNVSIEAGEHSSQGFHGAATLSVLAGHAEGELIGPAFGATLALAKTEVGGSETIIEEDYYVEGLEWLDSLGAEIISSSLGYIDWYTQAQLDGQTAITTKVAKTLAARGILLVTAAGNEGNYRPGTNTTGTLIAPADADSILAVGAVNSLGNLTGFSSTGPTADGRIKPDVVTMGSGNYAADWTNPIGYYFSQGTSFATPLTASAAALVLSAHPDATAMEVLTALKTTTVRINDGTDKTTAYPNNFYGWGRVDAYAAALSLGPVVSNMPVVRYEVVGNEPSLIVTVHAAAATVLDMSRFAVFARRTTDTAFVRYPFSAGSDAHTFTARIPVSGPADTSYVGYLTFAEGSGPEHRRPLGTEVFPLYPTPDSLANLFPGAGNDVPRSFELSQNYPNPFNAGTTITFKVPAIGYAELAVYNVLGQKVRTLFADIAEPGVKTILWSRAADDGGLDLPSGIYLLRLSTFAGDHTRKMMLLK